MIVGLLFNVPAALYASVSALCFIIPLTAGFRRDRPIDIFEPIVLLSGAIFFSVTLRSLYILLSDSSRIDFVLMGETIESINANVLPVLLGVIALTLGYAVSSFRIPLEKYRFWTEYDLAYNRSWLAIIICVVIGTVGLAAFIQQFGIDLSDGILNDSRKRSLEVVTASGETVHAVGYSRLFARMSSFALMFLAALLITRMFRMSPVVAATLAVLVVLSVLFPFLSSSRTKIIFMMLSIGVIAYYYDRVSIRAVLISLLVITTVFVTMGALRAENQRQVVIADQQSTALDLVLGATNGLDLARTSAIIERVPRVRDYLNGSSYLALLTAPIPRTTWPEKPDPSLDTYVKSELFGRPVDANGWPPGMIGEAWINFGMLGIPFILFIWGGILRISYETVRPLLGVSFPITVIWASGLWKLTWDVFGISFAQGVLQTLQVTVPMVLVLLVARAPQALGAKAKTSLA